MAAHGITSHCESQANVSDDGGGDYRLDVPRGGNARAQAVLETALSGLRAIAREYPGSIRVRVLAGNRAGSPKGSGPKRAARK